MTTSQLYDRTRQGLDIILGRVPQAAEALENPKKKFKYRADERTASAQLLPPCATCDHWSIIDYGLSQKPMSPIDIYMREKGMTSDQFTVALYELAAQYGVEDEKITQQNRPEWVEREKHPDEVEGQRVFETCDKFSKSSLTVWGKNVTEDVLREYGWKQAEYVGTVRDGRVKECHSTESYPIFVQECPYTDDEGRQHTFHKVYQPREFDKKYRFSTIGKEPRNYVFGLEALKRAYRKNDEQKLEEVFLVSGGSDGANCKAMGGQAVWLNSETAELTQEQHDTLLKYAKRIIQIGDTDTTGKRVTQQRAKQYLDIYTVTLPEEMMNRFKDARGHRRKDLKDYVELYPDRKHFRQLVRQARRAQFWVETVEEKNGEPVVSYRLSATSLCYFLELHGFYTICDKHHERPRYIRVDGTTVEEVYVKDIRNFLLTWSSEQGLPEAIQNLIRRTKDMPNKESSNLRELMLSFKDATKTSQIFYFRNAWVEITTEGIQKHKLDEPTTLRSHVWKHDIIQHDYVEMNPMFKVERREDGTYGAILTEIPKSDFLIFLCNSSRLYWRETDEFGQELTTEQQHEEQQCLAAKLACIGYYLHNYRVGSQSWAAILQDAQLAEDERECNGRSGKSIFIKFLRALIHSFYIDARNPDIIKQQFLLDGITPATRLVAVDECARTLHYPFFFGKITGPLRVEEKGQHPFEIEFKDSPKWLFATNYVIKNIDSSTQARLWPQVFSTYYHEKSKSNDYKESVQVRDTFGYDLLDDDYPEQKWQADIAFAMQCLQFYLSLPESERKIMPPMATIERRTQRALMGKSFEDWASDYYQPGSPHLDTLEDKDAVFKAYCDDPDTENIKPRTFTQRLKEYCQFAEHIVCYNPAELTEDKKDGSRIRSGRDKKELIYVRSRSAAQSPSDGSPSADATGQTKFPF